MQRIDDRLDRTLDIGLDDNRIFLRPIGRQRREHVVDRNRRLCGALELRLLLAEGSDFAGASFVFDDGQDFTCPRHTGEAKDFDRHRWCCLLNLLTLVVDERADFARFLTHDEDIAGLQRTATDKQRRNGAPALVELRLYHNSFSSAIRISFELHQFSLKRKLFQQIIEPGLLQSRYFDILHFATHLFDDDFVLEQALTDTLRVSTVLVALVDRNDHRHIGRTGMIDSLDRLRHDAVISSDDEDDDIGHHRTACAHFRESFVARCIEEGDQVTALGLHLIGTDMLCNAAGFTSLNIGTAQRIKQRGLAMVDMAHHGYNRRTSLQRFRCIDILVMDDIDVSIRNAGDVMAKFGDQQFGRILVDALRQGDGHAHLEQCLHKVTALFGHTNGEFLNGNRFGNDDVTYLLGLCIALHT